MGGLVAEVPAYLFFQACGVLLVPGLLFFFHPETRSIREYFVTLPPTRTVVFFPFLYLPKARPRAPPRAPQRTFETFPPLQSRRFPSPCPFSLCGLVETVAAFLTHFLPDQCRWMPPLMVDQPFLFLASPQSLIPSSNRSLTFPEDLSSYAIWRLMLLLSVYT